SSPTSAVVASAVDQQAALFAPVVETGTGDRLLVPPDQEEEVQRRFHAIQPLLDWRNGMRPVFRDVDGSEFRNSDQLAAFIAKQHGVSRATVWNWKKRFEVKGLAALCDQVRSDKGQSRFFSDHPDAARFLEAKYIQERLSIAMAYRSLTREWKRTLNYRDEPPSYSTVRTYLQSLAMPVVVVGREGARGYNRHIESFLQRDFESIRVNQVWVSDHRIFDVFVYNDCFPHETPLISMRVWETVIEDMRSRKIVGWAFSANPSSDSISSALRMAISQYGIPETFYIDNGKDYKKVGKVGLTVAASGVLQRLNINVQYCIPAHPQSKLVESFFSGQSKRFDKIFGNSYAGAKPALRPEECEEQRRQHAQWMQRLVPNTPLMPATQFILLVEQDIREYNDRPHSGRAMHGRSPNQIFDKFMPENARLVPGPADLAELFWDRQKRKVIKGGCVEIYNERYEPLDAQSSAALYTTIGREVLVACDPNDLGYAMVLDLDGRPLGRVFAQKLVAHGPVARGDIQASLRERRAVLRALKNYVDFRYKDVPTEVSYLRERSGVPALLEANPTALPVRPATRRLVAAGSAPAYAEDIAEQFLSEGD
ncbi:MAG TPA: DDE-type integrase/transposase/recombinase, partial [Gemmatimonadaceae bacterium]|nr:DDE-type integrase/transposase/recombinase [Gemmatimonadaceae bacterium]